MTFTPRDGWRRATRIAAEIAVAFVMLVALDLWLTDGTAFAGIQPNPFWLPVLVMALAYGTGPGVIAAAIASALWLNNVHADGGARDYLDHLLHLSLPPLLWFVTAVVIGEVTMLRAARHAGLQRREQIARRNTLRLTEAFDTLSKTNRRLQVQLVTEDGTIGNIVATAAQLASHDPAKRRGAVARLIALSAHTEDFACYRIAGGEARAWLHASQSAVRRDSLPGVLIERLAQAPGILHVARRADRAVLEGVGVAVVPLIDGETDALIGCLVIHALPFGALNPAHAAQLHEIAGWLTPLLADVSPGAWQPVRPAGMVA